MKPMQNNEGHTPFGDMTNTINGAGQTTSNSQAQVDERVLCKREREKARHASMTQEERDEKNKRRREKYQPKMTKTALATGSRVGVESTMENTDGYEDSDRLHRCIDQSDIIDLTDTSPDLNPGEVNASNSIDNIVMCPKERKRELDRTRRAAMSPEQKALKNKRRRELYEAKNAEKIAARKKLQMTTQEKMLKRKESKKNYNRKVREYRANNLHPDSLAMESPHFNPQPIFPSSPQSPRTGSQYMEIPELMGTPVYIAPAVQSPEVETPELSAAQTVHRHRVAAGERNALVSHRNRAFEANIGRSARGCAEGKCDDVNDVTQPSVDCHDGVTQESPLSPPNNCTSTQTQPSIVDGTSSMPPNGAQDDTPDSMVEDDYDADVIFEDDEEADEAYFFA